MRGMIVFSLTALFFLFGNTVIAGTIYTWTDENGVMRYSNSEPPEDAQNVQTIQEIQYDQREDDQNRREYDRMVEEASQNADRQFEKQAQQQAEEAKAKRQKELDAQNRRMEQERAQLQKAIGDLEKRALSPTFSAGQKAYLIKQVQDKIDQLKTTTD